MSEQDINIEQAVARLRILAAKQPLSKPDLNEAESLMRQLKTAGMANREIAHITQNRWSESTVKGYVKGVRAVDPAPWHSALTLLEEITSKGMRLEDAERAVALIRALESDDFGIEDASGLLLALQSSALDLAKVLQAFKDLEKEGLPVESVVEMTRMKAALERHGWSTDALASLMPLAKQYGDPQAVLQALATYGSLSELERQTHQASQEFDKIKQECGDLQRQSDLTRLHLAKEKKSLEALQEAERLGFGSTELAQLARLSDECGGPRAVLKMVKKNADLRRLDKALEQAEQELARTRTMIEQLESEHAHLKTAVDLCSRLMREYRFGFDAISAVFSAAQKYGEPVALLKAIDTYGSIAALSGRLRDLQSKVAERDRVAAELKARCDEQLAELDRLHGICVKVGAEVARVESRLNDSKEVRRVFDFISNAAPAGFDDGGPVALPLAQALQRWVIAHQDHLPHSYNAKSGLESLIKDLGA